MKLSNIVLKILWAFVVLSVVFSGVFIFFGSLGSHSAEQNNSVVILGLAIAIVPFFLVLAVTKLINVGKKDD